MKERVSVSIVTWNHAHCIEECIRSLLRQTHPPAEILVADNASGDATVKIVERYSDRVVLLRNPRNLGFCAAHNENLRRCQGTFVLVANPDVVFEPDYVETALRTFQKDPRIGTVCGVLYREGRILDGAGLSFSRNRRFRLIGHGRSDEILSAGDVEVFGADGAAPVYRTAMIDALTVDGQFFDEMFFAHKEDHDVSWRARLSGWTTVCARGCKAVHPRTFRPDDLRRRQEMHPRTRYHAVKNFFLVLIKNDDVLSLLGDAPWWVPRQLAILLYLALFERDSFAAYRFLVRHWRALLAARRKVMALRRATRREMRSWVGRTYREMAGPRP